MPPAPVTRLGATPSTVRALYQQYFHRFRYGRLAALLIGSVFASHTLLGYPIVQRMKLVRNEAVTVTIGATIFTDIAALLVVAVCIPIYTAGFSPTAFAVQLLELARPHGWSSRSARSRFPPDNL